MENRPLLAPLILGSTLSRGAKLTIFALRRYARQKSIAWPGQDRLASDIGASPRSVRTYLAELRGAGLVESRRRGQGRTNVYRLLDAPELPLKRARFCRSEPATVAAEQRALAEGSTSTTAPANPPIATESPGAYVLPFDDGTNETRTAQIATERAVPTAPADLFPLILKLTGEGIAHRVAARLVKEHGTDEIAAQLDALPHRKPNDRPATLVASIREQWSLPATLRAQLQRDERQRENEAADRDRRAREVAAEEARRGERERAQQQLEQLDESERERLTQRARLEVKQQTKNLVREGSVPFSMMVAARLQHYVTERNAQHGSG